MTKTELMETYTAEQLAEMVVEKERFIEMVREFNIFEDIKASGLFDDPVKGYYESKMSICESNVKVLEKKLVEKESRINHLQSEVEKYRKGFEDAKKERDCQIAEYQKKVEELTAENEKLKGNVGSKGYCDKQNKTNNFYGLFANSAKDLTKDDLLMFLGILTKELIENGIDFRYEMEKELKVWDIKIKNDKVVADFLPTEPIKVADMLINAKIEPVEISETGIRMVHKERNFDMSELRQIAEHLLVYCNNQKENVNE